MADPVIFSGTKFVKSQSEEKKTQSTINQQAFRPGTIEKVHSKEEFQKYFLSKDNFSELVDKCLHGNGEGLKCRWTAWRAFLGSFEVGDESKIRSKVKQKRDFYYKEFDKFTNIRSKQKLEAIDDNPLSTSSKVYFSKQSV